MTRRGFIGKLLGTVAAILTVPVGLVAGEETARKWKGIFVLDLDVGQGKTVQVLDFSRTEISKGLPVPGEAWPLPGWYCYTVGC